MKNTNKKPKCPECGCPETVEECDDSIAEGYRVCANPGCHQQWYVDVEYTPGMAGSGQRGICAKCKLPPTPEGHDGCLGTLQGDVMNACCGHGKDSQAYIQYWQSTPLRGAEARVEQTRLIALRELGYTICAFGGDSTECDECDKADVQLYYRRTCYDVDEGDYRCLSCIEQEFVDAKAIAKHYDSLLENK